MLDILRGGDRFRRELRATIEPANDAIRQAANPTAASAGVVPSVGADLLLVLIGVVKADPLLNVLDGRTQILAPKPAGPGGVVCLQKQSAIVLTQTEVDELIRRLRRRFGIAGTKMLRIPLSPFDGV